MKKNHSILFFFLSIFISAFLIFRPAFADDPAGLLPPAVQQFFDNNGNPLSSGKVYFYDVGTTTFKNVYNSGAATTPYTNPITLNAGGKPPGGSGIYGIGLYRQVVKDKNGNTIWDAVTAPTGGGGSTPTNVGDGNAVGTILPWSGLVAPNQYVFAYGQELSRSSYPEFFAAITLQTNVICTTSSNILTGIADTTQISVGSPVELNLCVSPGTTVISKTSSTVTVSNPSSVTLNAVAIFFPFGNGNGSTTFNVPDFRDAVLAGRPNMGGSDRGLISSTYYGVNPNGQGVLGGRQSNTLAQTNLPNLTLNLSLSDTRLWGVPQSTTSATGSNSVVPGANTGVSTGNAPANVLTGSLSGTVSLGGSATAFSNIQPTITINYVVKVTPDSPSSSATGVMSLGGMTGVISCGSGLLCTGNTISVNTGIFANQSANLIFAGPASGPAATPSFRYLSVNDFNLGTNASVNTYWRGDGQWASALNGCGTSYVAKTANYTVLGSDGSTFLNVTNRSTITFTTPTNYAQNFCIQIHNANPGNGAVIVNINSTNYWLFPGQTESVFSSGTALYYTGPHRYALTSPTIYVGPGGSCSDSNDGLTQNAAGQFCTLSTAITYLQVNFDGKGTNSSIQLADGTYNQTATYAGLGPYAKDGINLNGNVITPSNVLINAPASSPAVFCRDYCTLFLNDLEIACANASSSGVSSSQFSTVDVKNVILGACDGNSAFFAWSHGHVDFNTGDVISGNSGNLLIAMEGGEVSIPNQTLTCTGAFAETFFADVSHLGHINASGLLFSGCGSVTGTRYVAAYDGTINTNGGGINFFPGNVAGSTSAGGQYQ